VPLSSGVFAAAQTRKKTGSNGLWSKLQACISIGVAFDRGMSESPERRKGLPYRPEVRELVRRQREVSPKLSREDQVTGYRGWNERGFVPHRDEPGLTQFVTFRLADGFPESLRDQWERLLTIEEVRERRVQLEAWLDQGHGECQLQDERIAKAVAEVLRRFDGERYRLKAYSIMPNHVHVLFEVGSIPMAKVLQSWKGASAREANRVLGMSGPFWQRDYWDTFMRDAEHEERTMRYIQNNPVKAGLVEDWKAWPWTYLATGA
jgi:putative transposase